MVVSTLTRQTTVRDADDFAKRHQALEAHIAPLLQKQPGFVSREMRRDGDTGGMIETTTWQTHDDCRNYLRNGGAAMAATILDAFFPTAPFPNGNWVRETVTQ
jgi:hypothetical protein